MKYPASQSSQWKKEETIPENLTQFQRGGKLTQNWKQNKVWRCQKVLSEKRQRKIKTKLSLFLPYFQQKIKAILLVPSLYLLTVLTVFDSWKSQDKNHFTNPMVLVVYQKKYWHRLRSVRAQRSNWSWDGKKLSWENGELSSSGRFWKLRCATESSAMQRKSALVCNVCKHTWR